MRSRDMISQALTVSPITRSISRCSCLVESSSRKLLLPIFSSIRRSSGWNMMTSAIRPISSTRSSKKLIRYIFRSFVTTASTSRSTMLLAMRAAPVVWIIMMSV